MFGTSAFKCRQYSVLFLFVSDMSSIYMYFFSSSGVEGFTSQEDQEMISRVEKQLKRRFAIGSQVSEHSIVQDFTKQVGGKRAALQFFGVFFAFLWIFITVA